MRITTHKELKRLTLVFKAGRLPLLFVVGRPGTAKSSLIRDTLGDARYLRGIVSAYGLRCDLWRNRDKDYILDDVDACRDRSVVEIIKALCERDERKTIHWLTGRASVNDGVGDDPSGDDGGPPSEFTTTSRVVIIANDRSALDEKIGAIEDRGLVVEFEPTVTELHNRAREFFQDEEILDFVERHLTMAGSRLTLRQYTKAEDLKAAECDWRSMLLDCWKVSAEDALVMKLLEDSRLTMEQRAEQFAAAGWSERNFYYIYQKLLKIGAVQKPARARRLQFCSTSDALPAKLQSMGATV